VKKYDHSKSFRLVTYMMIMYCQMYFSFMCGPRDHEAGMCIRGYTDQQRKTYNVRLDLLLGRKFIKRFTVVWSVI
jgi:hypothetical protein